MYIVSNQPRQLSLGGRPNLAARSLPSSIDIHIFCGKRAASEWSREVGKSGEDNPLGAESPGCADKKRPIIKFFHLRDKTNVSFLYSVSTR